MRTYTVLIDAREKRPLPFPATLTTARLNANPTKAQTEVVRIEARKETLETADYLLEGGGGVCYALGDSPRVAVETKRSLDEIASQTLNDRTRARLARAFDRMAEFPHIPVLVYEEPRAASNRLSDAQRVVAEDTLLRMLLERRIPYILQSGHTTEQRRRTAERVLRLLIQGSYAHAHVR